MESQHTILIVFLWVLLIASLYCCWLTPALEWPLLSQVLCVWRREKASSIKYFTEEVSPRAKATQPDHIETLSVCFYFLRFVLLNVRFYVMVITASKSLNEFAGLLRAEITRQVRTISIVFFIGASRANERKACFRHLFGSLLCSFQHKRLPWIVVIWVNGNWRISAMLFRLELSYKIDTTAAAE